MQYIPIQQLIAALQKSWSKETSVWGDDLPDDNPARGQCVVSSLVVQDYYGGDLVRVRAEGEGISENHYFNQLDDGTVIDTTRKQYKDIAVTLTPNPVDLEKVGYKSLRERCLHDEDTLRRYGRLKQGVEAVLGKA